MWTELAVTASAVGYAAYASAWPSSQRWGPSLRKLPGNRREIALTFDDGPSNETARFLAKLDSLGVKATFFVCGLNVDHRPGVARAIVEAGHAIGNHTYSHPYLPVCASARVREEVARTQGAIEDATGRTPALFRPPFGLRSPSLKRVLPQNGLSGVHWTISGLDWKRDAPRITKRILKRTGKGSIICLHDGDRTRRRTDRSESLKALRSIVPRLKDRGYRFVVLPGWDAEARGTPSKG